MLRASFSAACPSWRATGSDAAGTTVSAKADGERSINDTSVDTWPRRSSTAWNSAAARW